MIHTCIIILKPLTSAQPSYVRLVLFFIINIVLSQNLKRGLKIRIPLITIDLHLPQEWMTTLFSRNTVCSLLTWFEIWYYENSIWFDIYIYNQKANCNGFICVFDTDASYNLSVFFFLSCLIPNIISCDIHRSGCIWWNLRSVILPSIFFSLDDEGFLISPTCRNISSLLREMVCNVLI